MPVFDPAQNYSDFRPRYPQQLVDDLRDRTIGDHGERLIDWGAGTGELTIRLSPFFDQITAIDHHPPMISVARKNADELGINNINWLVGKAEDLAIEPESCDLITSASAFHWMDRELLVRRAMQGLKADGALVLVGGGGGGEVQKRDEIWHRPAIECVAKYVNGPGASPASSAAPVTLAARSSATTVSRGRKAEKTKHQRRVESVGNSPAPNRNHIDFVDPLGFRVERIDYSIDFNWEIDEVVGYLYAVGVAPHSRLGDRREAFERELRESLSNISDSGMYHQVLNFYLLVAHKPLG